MSVRYYLPLRHDVIAKIVYNALIKENPSYQKCSLESPEYIHKEGNLEYWWNISIYKNCKKNTAKQTRFTSLGSQ